MPWPESGVEVGTFAMAKYDMKTGNECIDIFADESSEEMKDIKQFQLRLRNESPVIN